MTINRFSAKPEPYHPLVLVTDQLQSIDSNSFIYTLRGLPRYGGKLCDIGIGVTRTWNEPTKESYLIPVVFNTCLEDFIPEMKGLVKAWEMDKFNRMLRARVLVNSIDSENYVLLRTSMDDNLRLSARVHNYTDFPSYLLNTLLIPKSLKKVEEESKKFAK